MNIVERTKARKRNTLGFAALWACLLLVNVVLVVSTRDLLWLHLSVIGFSVTFVVIYSLEYRRLRRLLKNPLIYIVALRDEFGVEE